MTIGDRGPIIRPDFIDIITVDVDGARELRSRRGFVKDQLARAVEAIFHPVIRDYGFDAAERSAIALFVSLLHDDRLAAAHFTGLLIDLGATQERLEAIAAAAAGAVASGPFGRWPEGSPLARENRPGAEPVIGEAGVGHRLAAALTHAHLLLFHPRDARKEHVDRLLEAGWNDTQIVILTQVVSVLAFQLRIAAGLRVLLGPPRHGSSSPLPPVVDGDFDERPIDDRRPHRFTAETVAWDPWIRSAEIDENPGFDWRAVFGARRASSPSFRLSARDPLISLPLSRIEDDVFAGAERGLDRGERELGALAVSRFNGCLYCASVHARSTVKFTGEDARVERLLAEGTDAPYGDRWNALIAASTALTATPNRFSHQHVDALRSHGVDDQSMLDLLHAVGYFNFANRIMLGLGDPILR